MVAQDVRTRLGPTLPARYDILPWCKDLDVDGKIFEEINDKPKIMDRIFLRVNTNSIYVIQTEFNSSFIKNKNIFLVTNILKNK